MKYRDPFRSYSFEIIHKLLCKARKSPYWRRKVPNEIENIEEFRRCPITTRNEMTELYDEGNWNHLLTTSPKRSHIVVTSGGIPYRPPFFSCFSVKEFNQVSQAVSEMFLKSGIKKGRILITFPGIMPYPFHFAQKIRPAFDLEEYQSKHISGALFKHASIRSGLDTYCTGLRFLAYKISKDKALTEGTRIMKAYSIAKPEILAVSPNILRNVFFLELEKSGKGFGDFNTRTIVYGGSKLQKEDFGKIRALGDPEIISWIESGELGTIGYSGAFSASQSENLFYFTTWRQNFFETVDKDGHPLPFGSRGRIVVTRLNTFVQPLIRYDLEDEGQFCVLGDEIVLMKDILKL